MEMYSTVNLKKAGLTCLKINLCLVLLTSCAFLNAEDVNENENVLLGIQLGSIHMITQRKKANYTSLPILNVEKREVPFSNHILLSFEPKKLPEMLPVNQENISFAVTLMPLIPENLKTKKELEEIDLEYQITSISYGGVLPSVENGVELARDFCDKLSFEHSQTPEIVHRTGSRYICTFSKDGVDKTILGDNMISVSLGFDSSVMSQKNTELDKAYSRLK